MIKTILLTITFCLTCTLPSYANPFRSTSALDSFVCVGSNAKDSLNQILDSYQQSGDYGAFSLAKEFETKKICGRTSYSVSWVSKDFAKQMPELSAYVEVACARLTNDHCFSVQPVLINDEHSGKKWSGFTLVEYLFEDSPQTTDISQLYGGLALTVRR